MFYSALLLVHDNDKHDIPEDGDGLIPPILARRKKQELLLEIFEVILPFVEGRALLEFRLLPPFIAYLVHKGAAILTVRLQRGDLALQGLRMLKSMRAFLELISSRWLIAG